MSFQIRVAEDKDKKTLRHLLVQSDLNQEGIGKNNIYFLIAEDLNNEPSNQVVAIAGLEKRGEYGFIRSLVLESRLWNVISGLDFINNVLSYAQKLKFKELYLLTFPKSKEFFEHLNFKEIQLQDVPQEIKDSEHFLHSYKENVIIMKSY